ncbi:MAG: MFS transporter [Candidatus Paceibacterota bacterium]
MDDNPLLKKHLRRWVYLGSFAFSLHIALSAYINSSYVSKLVGEQWVGLFFITASFLSIILFLNIPPLLKKHSFQNIILWLAVISCLLAGSLFLITAQVLFIVSILIIFYVSGHLLKYVLDLYLESLSDDADTGGIRGTILTAINFGWISSPLFIGLILGANNNYPLAYLASSVAVIPFFLIALLTFKPLTQTETKNILPQSIKQTFKGIWQAKTGSEKDLHNVLAVDFVINFFYVFAFIYLPIYLNQHIGLPWSSIGVIFTIMLLPFIFLQYPLGRLADKKLGEKEIMTTGLIVLALATMAISLLDSQNIALWAIILLLGRAGLAAAEISKESYLFKHITSNDRNILSLSRMMFPISYIIGPTIATGLLYFIDLKYIFIFVGLVILYGVRYSLTIVDTK